MFRRGTDLLGGKKTLVLAAWGLSLSLCLWGGWTQQPQAQAGADAEQLPVEHAECTYFEPQQQKLAAKASRYLPGEMTAVVAQQLAPIEDGSAAAAPATPFVPPGSRTGMYQKLNQLSTIDRYIFAALQQAGVKPAGRTNDFEFIRRVTLDLTGRIPTPQRVIAFLNDPGPDKRARLVEELLSSPEWVDKWTMYFGDLYKNSSRTTQVVRFEEGRNAFHHWIHDALAANWPYDEMVREMIGARSASNIPQEGSFQRGELNLLVGGVVTGGPVQDIWDQQAANVAETFLGVGHANCILCHNGAGHLDTLSLWGKQTTRQQGWRYSSFFSHTDTARVNVAGVNNRYFWVLQDDVRYRADYTLNTTTGNRPARQPVNGQGRLVAPAYLFNGHGPAPGEDYRAALAREVTSDFQFARATVNYLWKEFFGLGLVEPPNQMDPARLDPDNPPPAPWTLQASNPRLLNALAQDFVNSGYSLKALMREVLNSQAYQLSARYDGSWNPAWQSLFARKLVRRLWAEEMHDSIAQVSSVIPSYSIQSAGVVFGTVNWAMQFPETAGMPNGNAAVQQFLDSFLRGDRADVERDEDGSLLQALNLMNHSFVMTRIRASGSGPTASLLARNLPLPDDQLVNNLFLAVLSRFPTEAERAAALANLKKGNRTQEAENLLWVLFNKVDFIFNY